MSEAAEKATAEQAADTSAAGTEVPGDAGIDRLAAALDELGYEKGDADGSVIDRAIAALHFASAERARLEAKSVVVEKEPQKVLRSIGPVKKPLSIAELGEVLEGSVELVFSDGKSELPGLRSRVITGAACWQKRPGGWLLREKIAVTGPAIGATPYVIAGAGLLGKDGKQIAWATFPNPVRVAGGTTTQFRDAILF